jgi:alkylhydroperoxidase family enzyme
MALQGVEWLDPLVAREQNRELEAYAKQVSGSVPPHTPYFGACPWILRADLTLDTACAEIGDLSDRIYLVVSRDNSCRFCYGASRMFMRMHGMSKAQIEQVEQDVETSRIEPRARAALDYVRRVSRSNPAPNAAEVRALSEAGFSAVAIRELALFAGVVVFHNRFATLLALPPRPAERLADSRFSGVLSFYFRRLLARLRTQPPPEGPAACDDTGPYAGVTRALGDLPHARALRAILDEAWASATLPPRSKALIFAVIARGLESASAEAEARRLLESEGLGEKQVDEILANLASPELDARESRILPYVRETIWYQPAPVQRLGRALREELSNAELLETIGTAALANMVCRISLALDAA